MKRLYQGFGLGLILVGGVHMATTFQIFDTLSGNAVWFFGAGMAIALDGALNLVNAAYGIGAPGLRWTCLAANVGMTGFAIFAGIATRASTGELIIVVGVVAGATLLSVSPRALRRSAERAA